MRIKHLVTGPLQTNTYIIELEAATILVDPGGTADEIIEQLDTAIDLIILTHGHPDHAAHADRLADTLNAKLAYCSVDQQVHQALKTLAQAWGLPATDLPPPDIDTCKNTSPAPGIRILHTPGHTPGSTTIHLPSHNTALTGDTIFYESIGRVDLPYANPHQMAETLHMLAKTLPDDTTLLPGHGPATTMRHEKHHNPYLKLAIKNPERLAQLLQYPL